MAWRRERRGDRTHGHPRDARQAWMVLEETRSMKCVMVMFDSLNRRLLPPYAKESWVQAPNFARLAQRSVTFDTSYVCSMPCMPARRDFHTGRPNFLHCPWGPIEPFDDSVPQLLSQSGTYTHLVSDHYHYWEDGGATYHTRYDSWDFHRGQEGDPFYGQVREPNIPKHVNGKGRRSDWVNREVIRDEADYPQTKTFAAGLDFIDRHAQEDNWFLQIETFDPHEPFVSHDQWTDRYGGIDDPVLADWPGYGQDPRNDEHAEQLRRRYGALVTKCDAHLGEVLDAFDRHGLWDDTMLIVWTDHGFMLGERDGLWAKNIMPLFDDVARTPFYVHDPRCPDAAGTRRSSLVQPAIDLGPTLLRFFGVQPTADMLGKDLAETIERDQPVRDAAIYGYFANRVNLTDGRYTYLRSPEKTGLGHAFVYTLMPTLMRGFKRGYDEATLAEPFSFTKHMRTLRTPWGSINAAEGGFAGSLLYDTENDPTQRQTLDDPDLENRLAKRMAELMHEADAPREQFTRMALPTP
ncbi:MAG: sulfatase [Planctomycetota bacterium]